MTRKGSRLVSINLRLQIAAKQLILAESCPPSPDNSSCDISVDASALLVLPAQCARQLQQRLAQSLLAVYCHQIRDDLPLVGDAHGQVSDKPLWQRVVA